MQAGNINSRSVKNLKNSIPDLKWSRYDGTETSPGDMIPYSEVPGPSRQAMNTEGASDHFRLSISWMLPFITGLQRQTDMQVYVSRKTSKTKWVEVCFEEMLAFLEIVIAMGLVSLPSVADFFSTNPVLSHPWFPSIMSRNRFQKINRYFHIANSDQYPNDKLGKVQKLLDSSLGNKY